jgi:AsmA protein
MTKLIKIILWLIGLLVALVVIAAILVPILVDPNDYKDEITQQVYKQTGRTLNIPGDLNLSFSLPLSVSFEAGQLELSNAEGFGDKPFARIQGASLYASIWPLLTENRLDVGEIKLSGMELNLIKNKQGDTNWDDLAQQPQQDTAEKETKAQKPAQESAEKSAPPAISVAGLNVTDATISWTDEQSGQSIKLSQSNITISELIEDKPFQFKLATQIDSNKPDIKGTISLTSSPVVSLSKQLFKLPETLLTLDLQGSTLPGGAAKTTLGGDITFNGQSQTLDISGMKLATYDMTINGQFKADQLNTSPAYSGAISIDKFSPKKLAGLLGAELPPMKEANALTSADAKITFNGNSNAVTISALEANLDDTNLNGNAKISNFSKPFYNFDLNLNKLDLDFYAMAAPETKPAAASAPEGGKTTAAKPAADSKSTSSQTAAPLLPVDTLRQLNLSGKLAIAKFIAGGAKMSNVVIVLKGNNGLVQLAPLKADLYSGKINLQTDIDARGDTPKLKIVKELSNVQLGDLLQDTTGSQEFTGAANISANITTTGNDTQRLISNSNGNGKLLLTDGHIKKLDIISTLRKAQALYRGQPAPSAAQDENTKFSELKGTFNIVNGVFKNNDLSSKSPVMELTGQGYADIPKEYLDYTLKVRLLNSLRIDEESQATDYKGKEIPYTIKGKFSELSQDANVAEALKQEVKKKLEKKINEKLEEKFGDQFKGMLKF